MGSREGALKAAAARVGLTPEQYSALVAGGMKRCTRCRSWHPLSEFGSDANRPDGLASSCLRSKHTGRPRGWAGRPRVNPQTGRPGPAPASPRDGDKRQARQRINVEVRTGRRPHPNALPCADCGHLWSPGEKRHEYDHHLGYSAEHHYDVEPVCTTCHRARECARGVYG